MFPPRPNDISREELLNKAKEVLHQFDTPEMRDHVKLYFSFTCPHCGERCTFSEPFTLYNEGECAKCGEKSTVLFGGFMLAMSREAFDNKRGDKDAHN